MEEVYAIIGVGQCMGMDETPLLGIAASAEEAEAMVKQMAAASANPKPPSFEMDRLCYEVEKWTVGKTSSPDRKSYTHYDKDGRRK
jgi:hypothetical protein